MFNMVISNYSMPDSSKLNSSTASRTSTKRTKKIKEDSPSPKKEVIDKELEASIISKKELEEQEYLREMREKKLKEALEEKKYRDISVRISDQENFFCLAVDGSQTSKDAFEIILTEFLPRIHDSVLICPHIYNNTQDENFNWRFQIRNRLLQNSSYNINSRSTRIFNHPRSRRLQSARNRTSL